MTRIFLVAFCLGFFMGHLFQAKAEERSKESGTSLQRSSLAAKRAPLSPTTYSLGLGGAMGEARLSDSTQPNLQSRGSFSEALLVGNLETSRLVFELGFGVFSSSLSGTNSSSTSGSSLALNSYQMEKAGEVVHLGTRYRLSEAIEAGVFGHLLFGTDVGFKPSFLSSGQTTAWLVGADALYGFSWLGLRWKAGGRAFTSLGMENRTLTAFQGVVSTSLRVL